MDIGKMIVGRRRRTIDARRLLQAMTATAAGVQDSVAGGRLVEQAAATHPSIRKLRVDGS